jgi:hypothetical protein
MNQDILDLISDFKEILLVSLFILTIIYQDKMNSKRMKSIDDKFKLVIKRLKVVNPEDLLRIENPSMGVDKFHVRIKKRLSSFKKKKDKEKV